MWLTIAFLWTIVLITHKGYNYLPPDIQPQLFYVARGIEGCALFLLLPYWLGRSTTKWQTYTLILCAIYGASEEALTAICGTNYYLIAQKLAYIGPRLCHGPEALNWLTTSILLAALLVMVIHERRRIGHG